MDPRSPASEAPRQQAARPAERLAEATLALCAVPPGACVLVQEVGGGRAMMQRMLMLGIRRGVQLRLLHGPGARGAVVGVGGARIALGRDIVEHIRVQATQAFEPAHDAETAP